MARYLLQPEGNPAIRKRVGSVKDLAEQVLGGQKIYFDDSF
jgi:hypothetical protein